MDIFQHSYLVSKIWQYLEPLEVLRLNCALDERIDHHVYLDNWLEEKYPLPQQLNINVDLNLFKTEDVVEYRYKANVKKTTNYMLFAKQWRIDNPNLKQTKHISHAWNHLNPDEKSKWDKLANEQNQVYMNEYITRYGPPKAYIKKRFSPKKINSYRVFIKELQQKHKELAYKQIVYLGSHVWSNFTDHQKKPYENIAYRVNQQYLEDFNKKHKRR